MKRVKIPAAVDCVFDEKGSVMIRSVRWEGRQLQVTDTGRTWTDDSGRHIMVIVPGPRVFELLFKPDMTWWIIGANVDAMYA